MMKRLFQSGPLIPGETLLLDSASSHYLADVLRLKPEDACILFNGTGGEFTACIQSVKKNCVSVLLGNPIEREAESSLTITLAVGISRGEKMDFILQKAVELGVKGIIPLFTEYCNVKFDEARGQKKWHHWQKIIISACEQCGRNQIPLLAQPVPFSVWLHRENFDRHDHAFFFTPDATVCLRSLAITPASHILLLTGPEGGFSTAEKSAAYKKKFLAISLGPRILRTETAPLAAITALQTLAGDMG